MTDDLHNRHHLAAIAELDRVLGEEGVSYWLFGGWAVDFHTGRISRAHDDIDIATWLDDRGRLAVLLRELGWVHQPEADGDGYMSYARGDGLLEIAFLVRDERGEVYTPVSEGRAEWPAASFADDAAELNGVRARVISLNALVVEKSQVRADPVTAAKDQADRLALSSIVRHS